jgi:rSAM/selenodomain-associated transferase 1
VRKSLLVFAKEPVVGAVKTRLVPPLSPEEAARIAAAFLADLADRMARIPDADLAVALPEGDDLAGMAARFPQVRRWISQGVGSLGDRLARTTTRELACGAQVVLVVGSDHPNIPTEMIDACLLAAERGGAAWVTTEDGGYAAIALSRPADALFAEIPWSTSSVATKTSERAREIGMRLDHVGTWYDVDRIADLARLAEDLERDTSSCPRTRALLREWAQAFEKRGILPRGNSPKRSTP